MDSLILILSGDKVLIKLLPTQVPPVWEQIKVAASRTGTINVNLLEKHCNTLLTNLMSGKSQCFVYLDEERKLKVIAITRITSDIFTGSKTLFIDSVFAYQPIRDQEWVGLLADTKKFALASKCEAIEATSMNERVFDLARKLGFAETSKHFRLSL